MIKVRILRTGAASAVVSSAALALSSLAGCAADTEEALGHGTDDNTASVAGSGALTVHG
jgi:hypothetical protein